MAKVCGAVLAAGAGEDTLAAEVVRVCRQLYPDRAEVAVRTVMDVVEAMSFGGPQLPAVRDLAESGATAYPTPDDMPPRARRRRERMVELGRAIDAVEGTARGPDGAPRDIPEDVLAEIERIRKAHGGRLPAAFSVRLRGWRRWRPLAIFAITMLVVLGLAALKLLWGVRQIEKARGKGAQAMRIAELEKALAQDPGDAKATRELAGLYVNRLITIQSLLALRRVNLDAAGGTEGLDTRKDERIAAYEKGMQITASPSEAERLATAGLALADRALAGDELSHGEAGTFQVVRGYCLLALGGAADARKASDAAAALDGRDIRPHLLNAAIAEEEKDYAGAVRELETALRKLDAWVAKGPSLLQEFVWGVGPTPTTERREWERRRDNIARRVRNSIQAKLIILRTLAGAQARGVDV